VIRTFKKPHGYVCFILMLIVQSEVAFVCLLQKPYIASYFMDVSNDDVIVKRDDWLQ